MRTDLETFCIDESSDLKNALVRLRKSGEKILFVVDHDGSLLGTLTDGDVRNWILDGGELNAGITKVYNRHPFTVRTGYNAAHVRSIMLEKKFNGIPVLNGDGIMQKVLFWKDVFGAEEPRERPVLDVPVVIMAGGKGTRLDPFTRILPKPLIPIGDKTVIETIIGKFLQFNVKHYYITVNHKAKIIKSYFEELHPNYGVSFIDEEQPLGTAGSLLYLRDALTGAFFLTNCDIIIDADYAEILRHHQTNTNDVTIVGSLKHIKVPYGVCAIENGGQLKSLIEKPVYDVLINTGMYVINAEHLKHIPVGVTYHMTDLIEKVVDEGGKVGVFPIGEDDWCDTGEWEEYKKALDRVRQQGF